MTVPRGSVVIGENPFGWSPTRPYLAISNDGHPFNEEEGVFVAITTKEREGAVPLAEAYVDGGLPKESFASPWAVNTLKHTTVEKRVAVVSTEVVERVVDELDGYVR